MMSDITLESILSNSGEDDVDTEVKIGKIGDCGIM